MPVSLLGIEDSSKPGSSLFSWSSQPSRAEWPEKLRQAAATTCLGLLVVTESFLWAGPVLGSEAAK